MASISYFEYTLLDHSGQVFYESNEMKEGLLRQPFLLSMKVCIWQTETEEFTLARGCNCYLFSFFFRPFFYCTAANVGDVFVSLPFSVVNFVIVFADDSCLGGIRFSCFLLLTP